jgi:hypothetical protein
MCGVVVSFSPPWRLLDGWMPLSWPVIIYLCKFPIILSYTPYIPPCMVIGDGSCVVVCICMLGEGQVRGRNKQGEEAAETFFLLSCFTWAVASTV